MAHMGVSKNRRPQNRPQYTLILLIETTIKGPLIFGTHAIPYSIPNMILIPAIYALPNTIYHIFYTMYSLPSTLYHIFFTKHSIPYILYQTLQTIQPIPYILYRTLYTIYSIPNTTYQIFYTIYSITYTIHWDPSYSRLLEALGRNFASLLRGEGPPPRQVLALVPVLVALYLYTWMLGRLSKSA